MARKKTLDALSAQELYELAKQREQEELEMERETMRAQAEELKEQRREMVAQHKRELAALDKQIRELGGRPRAARSSRTRGEFSGKIVEIIEKAGAISTEDLKTKLGNAGFEVKNLNQQLAYLKRRGVVASPERAVYTLAG